MPPIPRPTPTPIKPLSFEANASLLADGEYLRKLTMTTPSKCACERRVHFWHCDWCRLIHSGKARPSCPIGAAQ